MNVRTDFSTLPISNEEEILVNLLLNDAVSNEHSIEMDLDRVTRQLIDAEFVVSAKNGRYYLTEDGKMIAVGALELYPEIRKIHAAQRTNNPKL